MPIIFEGSPPYELITQNPPTTTAVGEIVLVTLPVFAAGFPEATQDIELRMTIEHAEQVAAQLHPALMLARARRKLDRLT
jgi:hypothetical protein